MIVVMRISPLHNERPGCVKLYAPCQIFPAIIAIPWTKQAAGCVPCLFLGFRALELGVLVVVEVFQKHSPFFWPWATRSIVLDPRRRNVRGRTGDLT